MANAKAAEKQEVETSAKLYELMLILNPELRESEVKKKLKEIVDMIEKAGGKITHEDFWGKKELAYKIKGNREGVYIVYNLELPNNFIKELRGHLRIEKEVLRSLILSLPAGHIYTKYDLDAKAEPKEERREERRERPRFKKAVSVKHVPEEVAAPPAKEEEAKKEDEDKGKEADEAELDKKLDEIIGGDDLSL